MFDIQLSKSAIKILSKLPTKHARQVHSGIEKLVHDPFPKDAKKLKGYEDFLRIDAGEYRIIYKIHIDKKIIQIYLIGKRNDSEVYRKFKRSKKSTN
jgi:mRNA interferase RelE/StbE